MTYKEFVEATICNLSQPVFEELKQLLLGEYISFAIIDHEDVTIDILAEKVCDYFGTLEIKQEKVLFDERIKTYMNKIDKIVKPRIADTPQPKKGDTTPIVVPRSRKYYEKAVATKREKELSMLKLVDYSRIMMCLYTAANNNEGKTITNFDYAADCLIPASIIDAMKSKEDSGGFLPSKKKRFDTKELYSDDMCTLIMSILILCSIINGKVEGEADHE